MAQLKMDSLVGPAVVGVVSGVADTLTRRRAAQTIPPAPNLFLDNLDKIADFGMTGLVVLNAAMPKPFLGRSGWREMLGAGLAVGVRQGTFAIGDVFLKTARVAGPGAPRYLPPAASNNRRIAAPAAAVQGPIPSMTKKQFFSVT